MSIFSANSIRWTVASEWQGPNRAQAKAMGLSLKRDGRMRRYYDATGRLVMAYSYNTCILTMDAPSEDYPQGRYIINTTRYGMTSNRHLDTLLSELNDGEWMSWWLFAERTSRLSPTLRAARELNNVRIEVDADALGRYLSSCLEQNQFDHQRELERRAERAAARKADKARKSFKLYVVK